MDNVSKRRAGRPKASQQTGPLVLERSRARVKIELEMADTTADELKEYARWVELSSAVATKDALFTTVDFALRDVFRRDRLWQEKRRKGAGPEPVAATETPPVRPAPSAALPPPVSSARPVPSPAPSGPGR
jgi:hypothetical protein